MIKTLILGYAGEYGARAMTIDLYEEAGLWPDATPKLLLCRPGEDAPYVFEGMTTYEEGYLTFTPRKEDTAIAGTGYAQVYFYGADGALLGKSGLMTTLILRAMSGDVTQEPSAEQKSYYDNLMEQVALAVAAGKTAPGYAQIAAESAAAAAAAQEAAEAAASSVTITTDEINAAGNAALSAIEQKRASALADIPDDYTALYGDVSSLKDTKADAIMDTSARAASHELHAQDGKLHVTLYGKTVETGTGDKSPDNPYTISGVDAARVHVGGKNLLEVDEGLNGQTIKGVTFTVDAQKRIHCSGTATAQIVQLVGEVIIPNCRFTYSGAPSGSGSEAYSANVAVNGKYSVDDTGNGYTTNGLLPSNNVQYYLVIRSGVTVNDVIFSPQIEIGTVKTAYEPYAANVIDMTAVLDGKLLYGNGKVDDTIENDVLVDGERKCRVTRRWKTEKLCDRTWSKAGTNGAGLPVFYSSNGNPLSGEHAHSAKCNVLPTVNNYSNTTPCFYTGESYGGRLWIVAPADIANSSGLKAWLTDEAIASYELATPETYVTDAVEARKADTLTSNTVTVTGSGETEVEYPHDTKHYTDSQHDSLARAVESNAEAVNSLSEDIAEITAGYELINRFTVSEDVASLVVDMDSAGKPFELVSAIFRISCGGNVVSGSSTGEILLSSANSDLFCNFYVSAWKYPGYKISETSIRASDVVAECDMRDGVVRTFIIYGDVGNAMNNSTYFSRNERKKVQNEALTKVRTKFGVPKNAEVSLYGIRKEKADG